MGTYNGNKRNDVIFGSAKDDFINGKEGDDQLHGGGGNDDIHGWYGTDQLWGDAGNDRLFGEFGNDTLDAGDGDDIANGGDGDDILTGGNGNDGVYGGSGDDTISGGAGHDEIAGNAGLDTMSGGADDDWFYFELQSDSVGAGDIITDYQAGIDRLIASGSLSSWDANAGVSGRQAFQYVGATVGAFSNDNGQATVSSEGAYTVLRLYNNDGDGNADFTLRLQGTYAPQDLQMYLWDGSGWTIPGIIF